MISDQTFPYSPEQRERCLDPLVQTIRDLRKNGQTVIVAIQGGQGTGKTTLASYLVGRLSTEGYRVVSFSIDDFYTSFEDRRNLAAQHPGNPYYQLPRGMPGTHRTTLLYNTLSGLKGGKDVDLPVFDKSVRQAHGDIAEDVVPVRGRQDFIIFEGWCIAMPAATSEELIDICRRQHLFDISPLPSAEHRNAVLAHLAAYQPLWKLIDFLVMLRPDSPQLHEGWRLEQEKDLIARTGDGMQEEQVCELVRHFLPFTYLCYEKISPNTCIWISKTHSFYEITTPNLGMQPPS